MFLACQLISFVCCQIYWYRKRSTVLSEIYCMSNTTIFFTKFKNMYGNYSLNIALKINVLICQLNCWTYSLMFLGLTTNGHITLRMLKHRAKNMHLSVKNPIIIMKRSTGKNNKNKSVFIFENKNIQSKNGIRK